MAGLTFCEEKLRYGRERAAAIVLEVEEEEVGGGEVLAAGMVVTFCEPRRCSCSALARAFSCVRTKYASCFSGC